MSRTTRILLGVVTVALILAGLVVGIRGEEGPSGEVLVRVGVIFGAVWLVAPRLSRPTWATVGMLVVVGLVVLRPRLLLPALVAAGIWWWSTRHKPPPGG